ncbi:hypothetical protein C9374_002058 [Naegleria lovaniensis]|uniref:Uncharacterized protein n=1 Tax=Naegleria lovaniensis TaxID=51637 RepID=A0AA88KLV8_NAELO|nr:uncharacterized protein C9374_002058 [Naegleria lovaniensis]KAG2387023.1 hypothetical protein C9374_002058 [Naegleria lovaniensis]
MLEHDHRDEELVILHLDDRIELSNPQFKYQFQRRKFQKELIPFSLENCSKQAPVRIPRVSTCAFSTILVTSSFSLNAIIVIERYCRNLFLFNISTKKLERQCKIRDFGVFVIEENYDGAGHDACIVTCKADTLPSEYNDQFLHAGLLVVKYDLQHFISALERDLIPTPLWVSSTVGLPIHDVCVRYEKNLLNTIYGFSKTGQVLVWKSSNGTIIFNDMLKWRILHKSLISHCCFVNENRDLLIGTACHIGIFSCQTSEGLLQCSLKIDLTPQTRIVLTGIAYESSTQKVFVSTETDSKSSVLRVYSTLNGQLLQSFTMTSMSEYESLIQIIEHSGELITLNPFSSTLQVFK